MTELARKFELEYGFSQYNLLRRGVLWTGWSGIAAWSVGKPDEVVAIFESQYLMSNSNP